jgi:hypothetical protein
MKKAKKKPKKLSIPPSYLDRVSEAKAALDQAHDDYVDAIILGDAAAIRSARRLLMIALANYLAVTGGEESESESESVPPI